MIHGLAMKNKPYRTKADNPISITDIASGRIKMSPKHLQEKRARDRAQTQAIERARNRFLRVLDGLRILIKTAED